MKRTLLLLAIFGAVVGMGANAAAEQPAAVYTLVCQDPVEQGTCPDGGAASSLILGSDGNFYGTAYATSQQVSEDQGGVVFSLSPSGVYSVVYAFTAGNGQLWANGSGPYRVMEGPDGMLYGVTVNGGAEGPAGPGTIFRVNKDGSNFQVIQSLCGGCVDGAFPQALVVGTDGNVYGTMFYGGSLACGSCGNIFRIVAATGAFEVVHTFNGTSQGIGPSSLVVGPDGTFYGTTDGEHGPVLFHYNEGTHKLTFKRLKFPKGGNNRPGGIQTLVLGSNGNLFGLYGLEFDSEIGLFEMQLSGANLQFLPVVPGLPLNTSLTSFTLGPDGNFWFTQYNGGAGQEGAGDIIGLSTANGSLVQNLSPFSSSASVGAYPSALISAGGQLWGTTLQNGEAPQGSYGAGVIYNVTP